MPAKKEIVLKQLTTVEELHTTSPIEERIWGKDSTLPLHQKLTAVKNGGLVLGAYLEDNLVGFQYSFAGFDGQEVYLCSHMLGIDDDCRHLGIGELLKEFQREEAKKLGYQLIVWTYDPLESVNGYLNIGKLGAICRTYIENCYGEMKDPLNFGLATDRFRVEWWLDRPRVEFKSSPEPLLINTVSSANSNGYPVIERVGYLEDPGTDLMVAIPNDFQTMKRENLALAIDWRNKTRGIFQYYFARGYVVAGFRRAEDIHYYLLTKNSY